MLSDEGQQCLGRVNITSIKADNQPKPVLRVEALKGESSSIVIRVIHCYTFSTLIFLRPIMSISQESMKFQFSPADIVLSCTICQETLSTIYADIDRSPGLRQNGEEPHTSKITKLWLTECAHLTCGKHLPGGGKSARCQRHELLYRET